MSHTEPQSTNASPPDGWTAELLRIMVRLRSPGGCPWDLEQTHASLRQYLAEECAEVIEAIDHGDHAGLCDELGDVLMNVVFHSRLAEEAGHFRYEDVARNVCEKMVRRHPHVFGDAAASTAGDVNVLWDEVKKKEKSDKGATPASILDGVPVALATLRRTQKIQRRAAKAGFDWPDAAGPLAKIREELAELEQAIAAKEGRERLEEELGDLLFSVVNLARHIDAEADDALRGATAKFERRFKAVEAEFARRGEAMKGASLSSLDAVWDAVKLREKQERGP